MNASQILSANTVLVYGAGKSGFAAVSLLKIKGLSRVLLADDKPSAETLEKAKDLQVTVLGDLESILREVPGVNLIVKSPGIPPTHPALVAARASNIPIIGELELAYAFHPEGSRILAITGTNGKTTTTAWANHLLQQSGIPSAAVGNIGLPFAEAVLDPKLSTPGSVFVVEASSFQLEDTEDFRPHVAVMTNFTPDHLDRYETLEDYFRAKQRIWKAMGPDDLLVINAEDPTGNDFAAGAPCRVGRFHRSSQPNPSLTEPCAWLDSSSMVWIRNCAAAADATPLLAAQDLALPGPHNQENALAAALAVAYLINDRGLAGLIDGLEDFAGVPHRIEACGEVNGVRFFNDSKATNVDATEKALRSFPPKSIVLIAGGRDKHSDYSSIASLVSERVRILITLGEAAPLIEAAWGPPVTKGILRARSMEEAVEYAAAAARPGDNVLLSPACASFDMYRNYEERGDDFKDQVIHHVSQQTL